MLGFLFRRLTTSHASGVALFDALTAEARRKHWYVEGAVPDTIDGRFAVLATVTALALVRIEQFGERGNSLSVALTERFIDVMESEHREFGLGDPALGKTVRKLVGSLSRRTDLWRETIADGGDWTQSARSSLYQRDPTAKALGHSAPALVGLWKNLSRTDLAALEEGHL